MENLKLNRIDFRLIHGQVMTRWVTEYEIKTIVVIDDSSAKNSFLKKILLGMAPAGIEVLVFSNEEAVEHWKNDDMPKNRYMLLFKTPEAAVAAFDSGIDFKSIQVGGIQGAGNKKNVYKNVVMSEEDFEQLNHLHNNDVEVYLQPIPDDNKFPFKSIINKFK